MLQSREEAICLLLTSLERLCWGSEEVTSYLVLAGCWADAFHYFGKFEKNMHGVPFFVHLYMTRILGWQGFIISSW